MKKLHTTNSNYRIELDGLRSIAVLSVIFYHFELTFLGLNVFEGGFIGVDIFFVISGYLISIIYYDKKHLNKFGAKIIVKELLNVLSKKD